MLVSREDFCGVLPPKGRVLGLDWGDRRVGVALSDELRWIASPHDVWQRQGGQKDLEKVLKAVEKYNIVGVVIGDPLTLEGQCSAQTKKTRAAATQLSEAFTIPFLLWDERWSSRVAERMLGEFFHHKKKADLVDKVAASYFLQGVLDWMRGPSVR